MSNMLVTIAKILTGAVLLLAIVALVQIFRNSGSVSLPPPSANALRIATYNVHYIILRRETGPWSTGDWDRRKGPMDLAFKATGADVMGLQESESFMRGSDGASNLTLEWLLANNPDYSAASVGDPSVFPSTQPILYRTDRLTQIDQGWFFFSETPDVIYSRTFNGSFPAFASWATFQDRNTQQQFRVVNVHTDYASLSNRQQTVDLIAARIAPWIATGETVYVIGDFNARAGSRILETIAEVGVTFAPVSGATFHFNRGLNLFGAIDQIGYSGSSEPIGGPWVLRQRFDGEWPTDHYPVIADFGQK